MSDFERHPILSRMAFFGDNSTSRTSATVGALRRAGFAARNARDPNDALSDDSSETDAFDRENRAERAHGDAIVDELLFEKGVDIRNDPLAALRILDGQKSNEALLRGSGTNVQRPYLEDGTNNPAYRRQSDWLQGWDDMIATPVMRAAIDTGLLQSQLTTYDDAIHFARTRQFLQGGFYTSSHLETALKVISSAKTDLRVGFYQLEHGAIAQAILEVASQNISTNVRLSSPHNTVGRAISELFGRTASPGQSPFDLSIGRAPGKDPISGSPINSLDDHFKFIAVNLDTVKRGAQHRLDDENLIDRMVWISSANATLGAMGYGRKRPGQAMRGGRNFEATFLLSFDLVRNGFFGQDDTRAREIFYSLTEQAKNASIWMMNENIQDPGRPANFGRNISGLSSPVRSKILETQGLNSLYKNIISDLTKGITSKSMQGVKAYIANYGFGTEFVDSLFSLLAAGGEVHLLRHLRQEGMATESIRALRERMQASGISQSLLVDTVAHGNEFIHAKTSLFEYTDLQGNRRYHQIIGSQNLSNRHFRGQETSRGGVLTRDLSIFLHGEEAVGNQDAASLLALQFRAKGMFRERSDRFRIMADSGWDRYELYGLRPDINIEKVYTAGAFDISTKMANQQAARALNSVKLKVGGPVTVGFGNDRTVIDLKDLVELTVKDYGGMGPNGTLFVQELSKFIGPSYGIRKFERQKGISAEPYNLEQLEGIREYSAKETLMAAVGSAQEEFREYLQTLGAAIGGRRLQQELMDPVNKGKIREAVRLSVRQSMEHFAGVEPGVSAYGAKQYSRLAFLQKRVERAGNTNWLLDLNNLPKLDIYAVEKALTGRYDPDLMYRLDGRQMFFTAGSLSSYSGSSNTPARFYEMELFRHLPMSAIVRRRNNLDEESEQNEFMFLLPQDKLMQLPQRLQNIMSARNLTLLEDADLQRELKSDISELIGESRLAGEDGKAVRGIRFRGFAVPGLGGDNAYVIGEAFENAYFGDESYRRQAKMPIATTVEASLAMISDKLKDLVLNGVMDSVSGKVLRATQLANGRVFLSSQLLEVLQHRLPAGLTEVGSHGASRMHYVNLNTDRTPGSGIILDAEDIVAEREQSRGLFTITLHGTTVRTLTSGDRSIIGGKFPYAFVQRGSRAVQTITQNASRGLFSGNNNDVNVIFGEKILKTGQAFIETGAELLATRQSDHLVTMLKTADLATLSKFSGLFQKFMPYMTQSERGTIVPLLQQLEAASNAARSGMAHTVDLAALKNRIVAELEYSSQVVKEGPLRFGVHHRAIAGSMLAFGLHTLASFNENQGKQGLLNEAFTTADRSFPARGVDFSQLTVQQVLGATYMTMVSAPSAAAVAMSSRNTVNFLHYHSDFYTDSFMDLMATTPALKERIAAYRELVVGGLLGAGSKTEFVFTALEFNPMSRYQPGFAREFQRVLEITRELQGYGTRDTLTAQEAADSVQRVRNLRAEYRAIRDSVHAVLTGRASRTVNILNETFTGENFREDYRALMSRTYTPGSAGSVQANSVTEFLEIQKRAGVGARVLFVPQLGNTDRTTGVFIQDPRGTEVRHVEVRFNSPGALLSIGSYDDFAHQMQKLQYDIETRLYTTAFIRDFDGKAVNLMDENVYRDYVEMQEKIGQLAVVQGMAAISDMQKMFGGRISVTGKNMIIGTLPEIPHGTMVLGAEAWKFMREGAAKEITEGLVALTSEQMKTLEGQTSFSKQLNKNLETLLGSLRSKGIHAPAFVDLHNAATKNILDNTREGQFSELQAVEAEIIQRKAEIDAWHAEKQSSWEVYRQAQDSISRQIQVKEAAKAAFFGMQELHSSGIFGRIQHIKDKIEKTKQFRKDFQQSIRAAKQNARLESQARIKAIEAERTAYFDAYNEEVDGIYRKINSLRNQRSEFFDSDQGYTQRMELLKARIQLVALKRDLLKKQRGDFRAIVNDLSDKIFEANEKIEEIDQKVKLIDERKSKLLKEQRTTLSALNQARDRRRAFFESYNQEKQLLLQERESLLEQLRNNKFIPTSSEYGRIAGIDERLNVLEDTRQELYGKRRIFISNRRSIVELGLEQQIIQDLQSKRDAQQRQITALYGQREKVPGIFGLVSDLPENMSHRSMEFFGYAKDGKLIAGKQTLTFGTETRKRFNLRMERSKVRHQKYAFRHEQSKLRKEISALTEEINSLYDTSNGLWEIVNSEKQLKVHLYGGWYTDEDGNKVRVKGAVDQQLDELYQKIRQLEAAKEALYGKTRRYNQLGRHREYHRGGEFVEKTVLGSVDQELKLIREELGAKLDAITALERQILGWSHPVAGAEGFLGAHTLTSQTSERIILRDGAVPRELQALYDKKAALYQQLNALNAKRIALYGSSEELPDGTRIQRTVGSEQEAINALHRERARLTAEREALYGSKLDPNDPRVLTGEMDRIPGSRDRDRQVLKARLEELYAQRDSLRASDASVTKVVELMLESLLDTSPHARDFLMSGLFQRSGAPPGPMGLVVGKILTIQEYNDMVKRKGGALMIHETMSARSVFLSSGSMAYNLGDFDGDTGSITWLQQFSRLKALDAIQKSSREGFDVITPGERLLMERVENNLKMSAEEHQAHFARFYTGLTELFDPRNLFFMEDINSLSSGARKFSNIDQMKSYFYGLEDKVRAYARSLSTVYDISTRAANLTQSLTSPYAILPEEINLSRVSANDLGMTSEELSDLIKFRERKKTFFGLATTANEYAAQIYEMQDEVHKFVTENSYRFRGMGAGADQAAFNEYVTSRGGEIALSKMVSAAQKLAGSGIAGGNQATSLDGSSQRTLSSEALMTYFMSTAFAATTIVSKVFEIGFSMSSIAEDTRARDFRKLRDRAEAVTQIRSQTENLSMTEFRSFISKQSRLAAEGALLPQDRSLSDTYTEFGQELTRIDQTHANIAGLIVTINQIAREAIKPRGGDPLEEIFRFTDNMNAAHPGETRNYVYGSQLLAKGMERYQGINALMQIMHQRDLSGKSVNIERDWKVGEGGEWDIAHRSLTNMLVDYYAGQVNVMYGMAASRKEQVHMLIQNKPGTGLALFQNAAEAERFLTSASDVDVESRKIAAVRMAKFTVSDRADRQNILSYVDDKGQVSNLDSAFDAAVTAQAREIIRGRGEVLSESTVIDAGTLAQARSMTLEKAALFRKIEDVSDQRAMDYMWYGLLSSKEKELRTDYMVALESGDPQKFYHASSKLSKSEKVKVLANSTSRGAFSSESGMKMIFEDIFSEFSSEQELRRAAQDTYTSDIYVDNLVNVYREYNETGNVLAAFERMRVSSQRTVEGTRQTFTNALNTYNSLIGATTHNNETGQAPESYLNVASQAEINADASMRARSLTAEAQAARQTAINAQLEYEKALALQEQSQTWMNEIEVQSGMLVNEGFLPTAQKVARAQMTRNSFAAATSAYDSLIQRGGLISSVSSNVLVPLAMSKLAGITMGAAGGLAGAAAGDTLMQEVGQFSEMAIKYASPLNAIRESVRQTGSGLEGLVHVGAVGLSMAAGAYAGERISRSLAESYTAAGVNRVGGGIAAMTMAASSIVGFGVGMAAMVAIEGLAAKFGFLQKSNNRVYGDLVDAGTQFSYNYEQATAEVDDLGNVQDENIAYTDASGETSVTGSFYVYAMAAREDDSFDEAGGMEADIGTFISGMSYDMSGGGVRDTVTADTLDPVTAERA